MNKFTPSKLNTDTLTRLTNGTQVPKLNIDSIGKEVADYILNSWEQKMQSFISPMLIFHPYAPNGEICTNGTLNGISRLAIPKVYISDCYGYSKHGKWYKLILSGGVPDTHWQPLTNESVNKEYIIKAMLLKDSF